MASITINTSDAMVNEINRIAEVENRNVSSVALEMLAKGMGENGVVMYNDFLSEKLAAKAARVAAREAKRLAKENEKLENERKMALVQNMTSVDIERLLAQVNNGNTVKA